MRLLSRSFVPEHIDRSQNDRRRLGLALTAITLDARPVALADAALASGFHRLERNETTEWRWTDGDALLRLRPMRQATTLELQARTWARYWQAPSRRTANAGVATAPREQTRPRRFRRSGRFALNSASAALPSSVKRPRTSPPSCALSTRR